MAETPLRWSISTVMADGKQSLTSLYGSPRMATLIGLGFASGVPLMLTSRTLNVWARDRGVDLTTIGLFSLITLPYAYKFAWAPLMDAVKLPLLGRRRGWLALTQLALLISIALMAITGPRNAETPLVAFAVCSLLVAFFSASQDIVADAYRTDVLSDEELGPGASVYMTGYRIAMLATGAGAVALASRMDWMWVYMLAAAGMSVGLFSTLMAAEPPRSQPPSTFAAAVVNPFLDFIARNKWRAIVVLLFIVLFKLPDYMAARMIDPLLLDLGFTKEQIAFWALGVGIAVTIPGVIVGGPIVARLGLKKALLIVGLAQALSNAGYMILAKAGLIEWLMIVVVGVEYFCTGLVVAGFVAFLMSQCNRQFSATQYALLSGVMGLSSALAGVPTGWLVERIGYEQFFLVTILVSVPGMLLIPVLKTRRDAPSGG